VFLFVFVKTAVSKCKKEKKLLKTDNLVAIIGVLSALFMLGLGLSYYFETFRVAGSDNDIYIEYAGLLFYIGGAFLIYSGIVTWFRLKKTNTGN
jgi:threonine/homoserine/homoserine lactone efflux protein